MKKNPLHNETFNECSLFEKDAYPKAISKGIFKNNLRIKKKQY